MLKLCSMNYEEFDVWSKACHALYKTEIIKNGFTEKEAQKKADEDFARLLPKGLSTPDQFVFAIKDDLRWVGTVWYGVKGPPDNRKAFVYDIFLEESERGKGFGKKTMELLENSVAALGLKSIGLHVFGHNLVARSLYEKMGYGVTDLSLEKKL